MLPYMRNLIIVALMAVVALAALSFGSIAESDPPATLPALRSADDVKAARRRMDGVMASWRRHQDWLMSVLEDPAASFPAKREAVGMLASFNPAHIGRRSIDRLLFESKAKGASFSLSTSKRPLPFPYLDLMARREWSIVPRLLEEVVARRADDMKYLGAVLVILRAQWADATARAIVTAERERTPVPHRAGFDRLLALFDAAPAGEASTLTGITPAVPKK